MVEIREHDVRAVISYPDCNNIIVRDTLAELRDAIGNELVKEEYNRHVWASCGKRKMASYCLQVEKALLKTRNEIDNLIQAIE